MKRHIFIRSAVLTMVASLALLTACTPEGGSGTPAEGGSGDQSLTFVTYGSALQETQEKWMIDPFMEETGIDVTVESPVDAAKLRVMVETGNPTWDVYLAGQQDVPAYCGTLFDEIDMSSINVDDFAPGTVDECGVPFDTYSYIVAYNTEEYGDKPPTSIADFFNLEKFPGTRAMGTLPEEGNLELALMADGVAVDELYPLDYDRAFSVLDTIKPVLSFWSSGAEQVTMMEEQRADMLLIWSGRGYEAVQNGAPYAPMWQDNSYHWASLAIVKGSPNKAAAQQFIDYMVSPEPQTAWAENIAYGAANLKATPALDAGLSEWDSSSPEHREVSWQIDNDWWGENQDEVVERWTEWMAG